MKRMEQFQVDIEKFSNNMIKRVAEAQQTACQKICKDIKKGAPVKTGNYRDSIQVTKTYIVNNRMVTRIYSNVVLYSDTNNTWWGVPLRRIIEYGTKPHFIKPHKPNGVLRWEDDDGTVHFAKYVWHPGTVANPHWSNAILRNREYYRKTIRKAIGKRWIH